MTDRVPGAPADAGRAAYEQGCALLAAGRSCEALPRLLAAVSAAPKLAPAWRLIGDIRLIGDDVLGARAAYDRHLLAMIGDPRLAAAASALSEGRPDDAVKFLRSGAGEATAAASDHLLAEALRRERRLAEAVAVLEARLAVSPAMHLARQCLALTLMDQRRFDAAVGHLRSLLAAHPGDHRSRMMLAASLTELGDYAGAAKVNDDIAAAFPDQPRAHLARAHGLRVLGRIDEAVAAFRAALALDPNCGEGWLGLANLKTYRFSPSEAETMSTRLSMPGLRADDRCALEFALARARDDAGDAEAAFAGYLRGNALARAGRGYDGAAAAAAMDRAASLFTPAFFAARAGWGDPSPAPIFIVGLPRSGTSLVEQILASHGDIEGLGERPDMELIAQALGGPDAAARLDSRASAALGGAYLAAVAPLRRKGASRFTDKAPGNFANAGLIHLLLPGAKIIDVRRHPLDVCVSAFTQHFAGGFDYACDLGDLGRHYRGYLHLMARIGAAAPGLVHRLVYERLVADTEREVRAMLAFLGLPFDAACLNFHENPRPVATPSSEQVRAPMTDAAMGRWRRYAPWLGPLEAALGPALADWDS